MTLVITRMMAVDWPQVARIYREDIECHLRLPAAGDLGGMVQRQNHALQAGIFPENQVSLLLHFKHGFRQIGIREKMGKMTFGPIKAAGAM